MEADRIANATRLRDGLAAVLPRLGAVGGEPPALPFLAPLFPAKEQRAGWVRWR